MYTHRLHVAWLMLALCTTAHADAILTLSAQTAPNGSGGVGYLPGTVVSFRVDATQDTAAAIALREVQLDFAASDPALTWLGPDAFPPGSPDGVPEFVFDYSTLILDDFYVEFANYPAPTTVYSGVAPIPGFILEIPASGNGMLTLGTGQIQLPTAPGTYLVDALNAGTGDPNNRGAYFHMGFGGDDPILIWSSVAGFGDGLITGNQLALNVVPAPGTLVLLAVSGLVSTRRRSVRRSA